jgi:hypothetical protein
MTEDEEEILRKSTMGCGKDEKIDDLSGFVAHSNKSFR